MINTTFNKRSLQVASVLQRALAQVLTEALNIKVTISFISVSPDIKDAKVFVIPSSELSDKEQKNMVAHLNQASPAIRHSILSQVELRYTPKLSFKLDDNFEHMLKIADCLKNQDI